MQELLRRGSDGLRRCWWCGDDETYTAYHDREWGRPVTDDRALFEKICLEGFQSGLAWITILRKRENFRRAFADFDIERVARFGEEDVQRLLHDAGIVRHRGKIEATITNAGRALELRDEVGSLAAHVWGFAPDVPFGREEDSGNPSVLPSSTPASVALSKDLKGRGWRFVGPTTVYSFMQSMGLVNDHVEGCAVRDECEELRGAARGNYRRG